MEFSPPSRPRPSVPDYLPKSERELAAWLQALSQRLPKYQGVFGLTEAELTSVSNDSLWMTWSLLQVEIFKNELTQRVIFKDNLIDGPVGSLAEPVPSVGTPQIPTPPVVPPGIVPRVRTLVQRLRTHPAYNDDIGHDLGVVLPARDTFAVLKPMGEALALPHGQVKVNFVKDGFPGVLVECQQAGDVQWTKLGLRVRSGCVVDQLALGAPGQVQCLNFRLRYTDGDSPVGDYSEPFSVTTMP